MPSIQFPDTLPITPVLPELQQAIAAHPVVIVAGETGSGKSTQLPKLLWTMFPQHRIGHTQPRRIAARTLAERIRAELPEIYREHVGYQVRFSQQVTAKTHIKLMTDGILLQSLRHDPLLQQYRALIIDEAHERSINIDYLLAYLQHILPKRPELRVVITSATLQIEALGRYFASPIFRIPGRTFPVNIRYCAHWEWWQAVEALFQETAGHILVFMPTEKAIQEGITWGGSRWKHCQLLPLYARLSPSAQALVWENTATRKVILATNVAETALTIPGITAVIDTGLARISRYNSSSHLMGLPIERISQAESTQRAGRAGREQPGICIRLEAYEAWQTRAPFRDPEIKRIPMTQLVLQQKSLGLPPIETLHWLDPPAPQRLRSAVRLLRLLGALDAQEAVTALGKRMQRLPIDPRWARALLEAETQQVADAVLPIVTALSLPDLRADPSLSWHQDWQQSPSDFWRLWHIWRDLQAAGSRQKKRTWITQHRLHAVRIREWEALCTEMRASLLGPSAPPPVLTDPPIEAVHRSLLVALADKVGYRLPAGTYQGAHGVIFSLSPGSVCHKKKPDAIVTSGIWHTELAHARWCMPIDKAVFEQHAVHCMPVKYRYADPRWERATGHTICNVHRTLFGLALSTVTAPYATVDPVDAQKIYITQALITQEEPSTHPLWQAYCQTMATIRHWANKWQDLGVLWTEAELLNTWSNLLPQTVHDSATWNQWLQSLTTTQANPLQCFSEHLTQYAVRTGRSLQAEDFPDTLRLGNLLFPLQYPDATVPQRNACITVRIPLYALAACSSNPYHGEPIPGARYYPANRAANWQIHYHVTDPNDPSHVLHHSPDIVAISRTYLQTIQQAFQQLCLRHLKPAGTCSKAIKRSPQPIPTPYGTLHAHPFWELTAQGLTLAYTASSEEANTRHVHSLQRYLAQQALHNAACQKATKRLGELRVWCPPSVCYIPPSHNLKNTRASASSHSISSAYPQLQETPALWLWRRLIVQYAHILPALHDWEDTEKTDSFLQKLAHLCTDPHCQRSVLTPLQQFLASAIACRLPATTPDWQPAAITYWNSTVQTWLEPDFWCHMPAAHFARLPLYVTGLYRQIEKLCQQNKVTTNAAVQAQKAFETLWKRGQTAWKIAQNEHTILYKCALEELRIALFHQPHKPLFPISIQKMQTWNASET